MTELLAIIDGIISENLCCSIILGGDFNLEFVNDLYQCNIFNNFIKSARLMVVGSTKYTYLYGAHNSTSFIDHFFINVALMDKVESSEVIDIVVNLSDHLPLVLHLSYCLPVKNSDCDRQSVFNNKQKRLRWIKWT